MINCSPSGALVIIRHGLASSITCWMRCEGATTSTGKYAAPAFQTANSVAINPSPGGSWTATTKSPSPFLAPARSTITLANWLDMAFSSAKLSRTDGCPSSMNNYILPFRRCTLPCYTMHNLTQPRMYRIRLCSLRHVHYDHCLVGCS